MTTTTMAPRGRRPSGEVLARRAGAGAVRYVLFALVAIVMLVPLLWLVTSAVKPSDEIYRWPIRWIPTKLEFANFVDAWRAAPFSRFFLNSGITVTVTVIVRTALSVTTAYAFSFVRFPFSRALFVVMLGAMMVPGHVTLLSNYLTVSSLGWVNTYAGLIVPGLGSVFGTFLIRQHMLSIPQDIVEAAKIDGAGHLRILTRVVAPMAQPVIVTVAIIVAVDEWNAYIWPLIVTNTENMRTLPVGLAALRDEEGLNNWGAIMAGTTMVALPVLIGFFIAQKQIMSGLTQGAIKG